MPNQPFLRSALAALCLASLSPAWGQEAIFRCGSSEYTNDARQAQQRGCQKLELGPTAVVVGTQVLRPEGQASRSAAAPVAAAASSPAPRQELRIDAAQQRARDADARFILESELRKAEARLLELQSEYNNGEPEKQGIEGRNHQRYLDRVQSMREALIRQQSDIISLKRELARLPGAAVASSP